MEMDTHEVHKITQIYVLLFVMHQKGKRHQVKIDINLKTYIEL